MMNRRSFLQMSAACTGLPIATAGCKIKSNYKGAIIGANAKTGHLLRNSNFSTPSETSCSDTVIIGAGISGLSAGYHLYKKGNTNFTILDLESEAGGNTKCGSNEVSKYPWGAHYIPVPNNNLIEYISFLSDCNVITGYENDLPVYNELYLCFDPQERLYINGRWQDGLVPAYGVPRQELQQIEDFLALMETYRFAKGTDGKDAFAIPVNSSSKDEQYTRLDTITMKQWLTSNHFTSTYLHWYVNYCTRDDFGTKYSEISAWTGIHYFASRKGKRHNASHHDVLTWPEGNGFLANKLSKHISGNIKTGCLAIDVKQTGDIVSIIYLDTVSNTVKAIEAKNCIMAIPQFIAARLLKDDSRKSLVEAHLSYSPWMVANLTVTELDERSGAPFSWDNVIYESESLGYVAATHELITQQRHKKNITYYLPLTSYKPATERKLAQQKSHEDWVNIIMGDLKKTHPNIETATETVNIMIWGHAMAQPTPGIIHGSVRAELAASVGKIHFAHTDIAGISIFEEAFYQGLNAAKKITT